jgi:hypothetical protein
MSEPIDADMRTTGIEAWEEVRSAGERVAYAYEQFVAAADELADVIGYKEDYILRRVLPNRPAERRNSERIVEWLERDRTEILGHLAARQAAREAAVRREALLARLNLTAEERRVLGIEGRGTERPDT